MCACITQGQHVLLCPDVLARMGHGGYKGSGAGRGFRDSWQGSGTLQGASAGSHACVRRGRACQVGRCGDAWGAQEGLESPLRPQTSLQMQGL